MKSTLLVCATRPEWEKLKKPLGLSPVKDSPQILYSNRESITLLQTGIGPARASAEIQTYLKNNRPDRIIHFGLSGALDPTLKTGDVFVATSIVNESNQEVSVDVALLKKAQEAGMQLGFPMHAGKLLTASQILTSPISKQKAGHQFDAQLVDMESFEVCKVAQLYQIPYFSIRAVFDGVHENLTQLAQADLVAENGNLSISILKVILRPGLFLSLPRYQRMAKLGNQRLKKSILSLFDIP